jgi:hypothetical protein
MGKEAKLEDVDPIFSEKKNKSSVTVTSPTGEFNLADVDPIFAPEERKLEDKPIVVPAPPSDVDTGAGVGAVVGYAAQKLLPPVTEPKVPGYTAAKLAAIESEDLVQRRTAELANRVSTNQTSIDDAYKELQVMKSQAEEAARKLEDARERAVKLGAIPEPKPITPPSLNAVGTSEAPGSLTQGALRHSEKMGEITQANTVRKGIAGTAKGLSPEQRMPLTGYAQNSRIIVPDYLAQAPIYTQEQLAAQKELSQAETAYKSFMDQSKSAQAKWQGLTKAEPKSVSGYKEKVATATETAATKAKRLAEIEKMQPGGLKKVGYALSKVPYLNVLGGALSGAEAVNAYEQWQKQQYLDSVMSGMGAAGGALSMVPHPYAKVAGALMSVPPLAYQGYQYLTQPKE